MKNINYLNYFFVGIPVVLILFGYLTSQSSGNLIGCGLLFTILTGLFQIVIGAKMLIDEPNDKMLQTYIISVILFFTILVFNGLILYSDILYFIFYPIIYTSHASNISYNNNS